ncbi:hypothetical protein LCGC14_1101210 [marine sediment metagenome]|uniref:Aminotransferase class I/classII large domain-containing protein n=1 Tax=marine sediment metagenome TaxID=412755 RepID=A0A0F9M9E3_9ZZZZ
MDGIVKKQFSEMETYIPGRPIEKVKEQYGLERVIKLASNESPLGPMPAALDAIKKYSSQLNRYPDIEATILRDTLAKYYKLPRENFLIGNGSNELLRIAGQAVLGKGDEVIFAEPSFVVYRMVADFFEAKSVPVDLKNHTHDLEAMLAAITEKTKLIFICNPNNPTGTMVSRTEVEDFINKVPEGVLVVVDEAYAEFVEERDAYPLDLNYSVNKPIIVTRTFSKLYGLAGLRIGYGVAPPSYVAVDQRIRDPFNVNLLAQVAATVSLDDKGEAQKRYQQNLDNKRYLYKGLKEVGLDFVSSQTNFILIDLKKDSTLVFEKLLEKGVIVRTGEIFTERYRNYIRVSIGSKEEIDIFLEAIKTI